MRNILGTCLKERLERILGILIFVLSHHFPPSRRPIEPANKMESAPLSAQEPIKEFRRRQNQRNQAQARSLSIEHRICGLRRSKWGISNTKSRMAHTPFYCVDQRMHLAIQELDKMILDYDRVLEAEAKMGAELEHFDERFNEAYEALTNSPAETQPPVTTNSPVETNPPVEAKAKKNRKKKKKKKKKKKQEKQDAGQNAENREVAPSQLDQNLRIREVVLSTSEEGCEFILWDI
jgi:hypothetical protein